jgi:hypothetical protein
MTHHPHHTLWYRFKNFAIYALILLGAFAISAGHIFLTVQKLKRPKQVGLDTAAMLQRPVQVEMTSTYYFHPEDGVSIRLIKNVGLTFYSRGDGYTPGKTMRSGRVVYEGAAAVSHGMWGKDVVAGDLIYVIATKRWYRVEDTMHEKYTERRVDLYTHDMAVANSGASRTDILIVRQPR